MRTVWDGLALREAPTDGPVAFTTTAELKPVALLEAYRAGLYPFPAADEFVAGFNAVMYADAVEQGAIRLLDPETDDPAKGFAVSWWSPDPRPVFPVAGVHLERSLARRLRNRLPWSTTLDERFEGVVQECRAGRDPQWLTDDLVRSLVRLHELGWAHSVEVWEEGELIGGVYGIQVGRVFSMDSMFFRRPGASRTAVADLGARFGEAGGELLDAQWDSPHVRELGAVPMPRDVYLRLLHTVPHPAPMSTGPLPVRRLVAG